MSTWLVFFLVCFAGIGFMFYCVLRRQDAMLKVIRDEHAQFRVLLRAMSTRLDGREEGQAEDPQAQSAPVSVDAALDAYARKGRLEMDAPRPVGAKGMPDLKF